MAFFGYHQPNQDLMASNAVNTALELRERFKITKDHLTQQVVKKDLKDNKIEISLKCGIHFGDVLFGLLETKYRNQITLIGSNVNFANRSEGIADNEDIIVSEDIFKLIKDNMRLNHLSETFIHTEKFKFIISYLSKMALKTTT